MTRARLIWLQSRQQRGIAVVLWLCLAATLALPALLSLIGARSVQLALAQTLASDGGLAVEQRISDQVSFDSFEREVNNLVTTRLGPGLVSGGAYASAGPLHLVLSVNGQPPSAAAARMGVTADYSDSLASHVTVVAGQLPEDGLSGAAAAVAMSQITADQLGLQLSDEFCAELSAGVQPAWCGRIVGLWKPRSSEDPYWRWNRARLELTMARGAFFDLLKQRRSGATAGRVYWARPGAIEEDRAPAVAAALDQLSRELGAQRQLDSPLATGLERFDAQRRAVLSTLVLLTAGLLLAMLSATGLVGKRFLDAAAPDRAVLVARGWPRRRVWGLSFAGLAGLVLLALPVGLVVGLLLAAAATDWPASSQAVRASDFQSAGIVLLASAVGVLVVLSWVAAQASSPGVEPADPSHPSVANPARRAPRRRAPGVVPLPIALVGALLLVVPRLAGDQLRAATPDGLRGAISVAPTAGVLILAAAAAAWLPTGLVWASRRGGVPGLLARRQLERRPGQHALTAILLTLTFAAGLLAAVELALGLAALAPAAPALLRGLESAALVTIAATLVVALTGFGMHFRAVSRSRLEEYRGLFAHGLRRADVARSLADEQRALLRSGALRGAVLGGLVVVALSPWPQPSSAAVEWAAASAAGFLACLLTGMLIAGWLVRRMPAAVNPLREDW